MLCLPLGLWVLCRREKEVLRGNATTEHFPPYFQSSSAGPNRAGRGGPQAVAPGRLARPAPLVFGANSGRKGHFPTFD